MGLRLVWAAGLLVLAGLLLLLWRRRFAHSRPGRAAVSQVAGAGLIALGVLVVIVWAWAGTATDTSQLARTLLWGDSDVGDIDRFPTRPVAAADEPLEFELGYDSATIDTFDADGNGRGFAEVLGDSSTRSFIVVRDGVLVYEEYFDGADRMTQHPSFSVAKSIVATLIGIAVADDQIGSIEDSIVDYLPELIDRDPRFSSITIRNLLTMTSGIAFDDGWLPWADPANTYYGTDLRNGALRDTEIERPPGGVFHYNDWNVVMLGMILERTTNVSISDYLEMRLWQPMGAEGDASWSLDSDDSGFEKSFVGVNAWPIDYARFGQLYLREGRRGETEVVPADFVREATARDIDRDPAWQYQYLWWVDVSNDAFYANGDHCQFIYVDPATDIVIVRTGSGCGDIDWPDLFTRFTAWYHTTSS